MNAIDQHADMFKAMGDATRLRILRLLLEGESLCVCEIVDTLSLPQYQISRNLTILKRSGLVTTTREGTWMYYSIHADSDEKKILFNTLKEFLNTNEFQSDIQSLQKRLALRTEGRCVIGFVSEEELNALISTQN